MTLGPYDIYFSDYLFLMVSLLKNKKDVLHEHDILIMWKLWVFTIQHKKKINKYMYVCMYVWLHSDAFNIEFGFSKVDIKLLNSIPY